MSRYGSEPGPGQEGSESDRKSARFRARASASEPGKICPHRGNIQMQGKGVVQRRGL